MANKGGRNRKWTLRALKSAAKQYATSGEFRIGNFPAYNTACRRGVMESLFPNTYKNPCVKAYQGKWTFDAIRAEVDKFPSQVALRKCNRSAYMAAWRNGFLPTLFPESKSKHKPKEPTLVIPPVYEKVSNREIREIAWRYTSKESLKKLNPRIYHAANLAGILKTALSGHGGYRTSAVTEQEALERAKPFPTKHTFKLGDLVGYLAAVKLKLINELFKNNFNHGERDRIYIWRYSDTVFKVGVTSGSLGLERIKWVAKKAGCTPIILVNDLVGYDQAMALEMKLLRLGKQYSFDRKFNGHTEFVEFTDDQLDHAIRLIKEASCRYQANNQSCTRQESVARRRMDQSKCPQQSASMQM